MVPTATTTMNIYLAGPMYACDDEETFDWREQITEQVEDNCVSPPRLPLEEYEEVVNGDLVHVHNADLIVAYAWKPSWGTGMELWEAHIRGIPILLIWPFETTVHPWLHYISACIVHSVEAAIMAIEHYPLTST